MTTGGAAPAAIPVALEHALDALQPCVALLDVRLGVRFVNAAWRARTADPGAPFAPGVAYPEVVPAAIGGGAEFVRAAAAALAGLLDGSRSSCRLETRARGAEGDHDWVVECTRLAAGDQVLILAVHEEVTELRAARAALDRGQRIYRAVFDQSYQAAWMLTLDGAILAANQRAQTIMNRSEGAALGHQAAALAFPRAQAASRAALVTAIERACGGQPATLAVEDLDDEGVRRCFDVTLRCTPDPAGAPLFLVLEASEVTERRRFERELVAARLAAEAADRAKSSFLARMSHELRTPLHAVLGFTRLLLGDAGLGERPRESLRQIESAGELLLARVDDVLELARIEAGGLAANDAPADVGRLLDELACTGAIGAAAKGLRFSFERATGLPAWLLLDEPKLRRALGELLANAVRFTDRGEVTLRADWEPGGGGGRLRLEVVDTGCGIDPTELPLLLSPFDPRRRPTTDGTGLGLGLALRLVRLMGGDLDIESEPGRGSRFRIELPVGVVQGLEQPAAPPAALAGLPTVDTVRARLARLPATLRDEIRSAAETADYRRLERALAGAVTAEPGLEAVLSAALERFDYGVFLRALSETAAD